MAAAEGGAALVADASAGIAEAVEQRKRYAASRLIGTEGRLKLARVYQSVAVLRGAEGVIEPDAIMEVYGAAERAGMAPGEMTHPDNVAALVAHLRGDA